MTDSPHADTMPTGTGSDDRSGRTTNDASGPITATASVPTGQHWKVVAARLRHWLIVAAIAIILAPDVAQPAGMDVPDPPAVVFWMLFGLGMAFSFVPRFAVDTASTPLAVPVRGGRWLAMNSPTTRVPSHATLAYGQSHAVDILADPADRSRPDAGNGFRRPEEFPSFGAPIHSPVNGVVVLATGWRRDHRSRGRAWGLLYLLVEGMLRELGGPGFVVGNHVIVRRSGGGHVLLAHLQRRSVQVRRGDRVQAGQVIAACGNSGNSSEPHLHLQLMDYRRPSMAAGLPFHWACDSDSHPEQLPPNGSHFEA